MSKYFKIIGNSNTPIQSDWQTELVTLLGSKPRRLSRWCELGLFGALLCIKNSNQQSESPHLSNEVDIRVYTESSTIIASQLAIEQSQEHLPMPFTFMQTQPGQLFNALGAAINWHGDGSTVSGRYLNETEIELLQTVKSSVLIGWVDEVPELISRWIWLEKVDYAVIQKWKILSSIFQTPGNAKWIHLQANGQLFQNT